MTLERGHIERVVNGPGNGVDNVLLFPDRPAGKRAPLVLMATRHLQVRAIGSTTLRAAGFRVEAESRGEAILAAVEALQPDLILTDQLLDDMDVACLCARARSLALGRTVPILVISDLYSPIPPEVLAEDFTDVVSAPLNWKLLVFRIHRWIALARKFRALSDQELDLEQVRDSALKASTELLQLRNYDAVTGLPNREMFVSMVGLVISQNRRSSGLPTVLFLDIDDFKAVNDLLGRVLGDELLKIVAKRLQGCLREGDLVSQVGDHGSVASFARLNVDQFAILLSSVQDRQGAAAVARRLLQTLSRPLTIRERQFRLTARVGIADAPALDGDEEEGAEELLVQRAEIAMRYCKQHRGRSFAFFESFMNESVVKKVELKAELRQALDREQLTFFYQFLVDSRTSVPTGVEALVRWRHPTRGLVPPNEFLSVAEESELIVEIDRWVLKNGCLQGKRWLDAGLPPLMMSLNVSMRFLEEKDFAAQILAIVEKTGLPPGYLQLELSERGTLPDADRIMSQFEMLVARGIHLALDDFGTGQTSLSYLRTLPISCVKVDRSFVSRVPDDAASVGIVTAIAAMSKHLGLKLVAEGVETAEHCRFLSENGYDQLQGFLFSRPQSAADVEKALRARGDRPMVAAGERPPALPVPSRRLAPAAVAERKEQLAPPVEEAAPVAEPVMPVAAAEAARGSGPRSGADDYLLQRARYDFLTKLYNRFSFEERLEHAIAHADRFGHQVALILIDLDDFKYVNDTHGHAVGDELLIAIAEKLDMLVRKVDTLARIGGDEFAVIVSEFGEEANVAKFAGRLLSVLARPVQVEGMELRVTGSLGVSVYPAGQAPKDILRQADLALYKAKSKGGDCVRFFASEMDREANHSLALARDLSGAVERGELFLEYQLQVVLESGLIEGVEALLRWNHPTEGLVDPARLIPIAENTGEMRAIGRWVIRSACAQARRWQVSSGRDMRVSVNLSPVQCRDSRFEETVREALRENELAPELLDLEVNEKLLQRLPPDVEDALRRLGESGVGLTLDNFGSGASALEHFQRFRFDRLKIHQGLVREIGSQSASASVLSGIVALAHKIGVRIVAEGVEEPRELEALLAEGCDLGQGYLFSRPLSADAVSELMSLSGYFRSYIPEAGRPALGNLTVGHRAKKQKTPADAAGESAAAGEESTAAGEESAAAGEESVTAGEESAVGDAGSAPAAQESEPPVAWEQARWRDLSDGSVVPALADEQLTPPAAPEPEAEWPAAVGAETPPDAAGVELRRRSSYSAAAASASAWKRQFLPALAQAALVVVCVSILPGKFTPAAPYEAPPAATAAAPQETAAGPLAEAIEPAPAPPEEPAALPEPVAEPATPTDTPLAAPEPEMREDTIRQIVALAETWARAWSGQRVDDYLRLYAADFRPPDDMSRSEWEALRRTRILKPGRIEVKLSAVETEIAGDERARVSFDQIYRSDTYTDQVRKTLELVREADGWKILAESTISP